MSNKIKIFIGYLLNIDTLKQINTLNVSHLSNGRKHHSKTVSALKVMENKMQSFKLVKPDFNRLKSK